MDASLSGIGGTLLPRAFLAERARDLGRAPSGAGDGHLARWWERVAARCGPATGLRGLFDLAAMPLFAALGFRATTSTFDRGFVTAALVTPGQSVVCLHLLPWAARRPSAWRDASASARAMHADWCVVFAPPFLSLIDARGRASRRSVDVAFPHALLPGSLPVFRRLFSAEAFDAKEGLARWLADASTFQDRVRRDLEAGVADSLRSLMPVIGDAPSRFGEALTLVYRVLFLLFAESRRLVPIDHPIYRDAYSIESLCREACLRPGAPGLWDGLAAITRLSRGGAACGTLRVFPFNGHLFARQSAPSLESRDVVPRPTHRSRLRDEALQRTLKALGSRAGRGGRVMISYADLGVEQLGSVYERVLDLDPAAHQPSRKESGTFYTPQPLADFLVRRTLAPLVAGASADRILALRVVDPAMGSGAFLVSALRYLAERYERALVDEGRLADADIDEATRAGIRRDIAQHCLFGVDANPIAVQLARLSLWLATLAHRRPLSFLDHRLRSGNSLVGTSPDDLWRQSGARRMDAGAPRPLFADALELTLRDLVRPLAEMAARPDDTLPVVREKEAMWARLQGSQSPAARWRLACHLWCARWFWPLDAAQGGPGEAPPSPSEIRAAIAAITRDEQTLGASQVSRWSDAAERAAASHGFFHWPLEFPEAFYGEMGDPLPQPGFDAVIGNPPWEMLRHDPAAGKGASRTQVVQFIRGSGLYPSCGRGHVNLYQPFVERALTLARTGGRVGLVLPWGLATDDGASELRRRLLDGSRMDVVVGLDNGAGIFPVHRGLRFMALVTTNGGATERLRGRFGVRDIAVLDALPAGDGTDASVDRAFPIDIPRPQLTRIAGPLRRFPDARHADAVELLAKLASRHAPLGDAEGWAASFGRELNATDDRDGFGPRGLPVIDGKHIQPFHVDVAASGRRIPRGDAERRLPALTFDAPRLAYRDVSAFSNRLSLIAAIVSPGVVTTHTLFCLRSPIAIERQHYLCAVFNSYVMNYLVRMLMGGHLTTSLIESLPIPAWGGTAMERRIARLAHRLSQRPGSAIWRAELQGAVARHLDLDLLAFQQVLGDFPLVPQAEREQALAAFQRSTAANVMETY